VVCAAWGRHCFEQSQMPTSGLVQPIVAVLERELTGPPEFTQRLPEGSRCCVISIPDGAFSKGKCLLGHSPQKNLRPHCLSSQRWVHRITVNLIHKAAGRDGGISRKYIFAGSVERIVIMRLCTLALPPSKFACPKNPQPGPAPLRDGESRR
jgi:hypothetical protein